MIRINSIKFQNSGNDKHFDSFEDKKLFLINNLKNKSAKLLKISAEDIEELTIKKHSVDARKKPDIFDVYVVDISLKSAASQEKILKRSKCKNAQIVSEKKYVFPYKRKEDAKIKKDTKGGVRPIIVGAGPAGLFCAYELAMHGYKPIVLERGMDVDKRQEAVEKFWNGGELNPKGNVQFGEGGAGTFSDGKLNTMVKDKMGRADECLGIFVQNGACEDIMYEGKPHIGTDVLRDVVKNMRKEIIKRGGEFFFETKVTGLITDGDRIAGVKCDNGKEFYSDAVVLAIGHSARDTFEMLKSMEIEMIPKAFAVGLRVEHPQTIINKSQYGIEEPSSLPVSPYKVTATASSGRGVYSFCMCPGGYVVNASSEEGRLAVNGMSYSDRAGKNANSAIIVTITPDDFGGDDVLSGMYFQRKLEEKAFEIGKGKVPCEYFDDFREGTRQIKNNEDDSVVLKSIDEHLSEGRNMPQIKGAYAFSPVHRILPAYLSEDICECMTKFGKMINGFDRDDAIFSGVESRTSSPVRITRDENLESISLKGLYPCGEGAGYAGGITSAAMDGIKVAEEIAIHFYNEKDYCRNKVAAKRKALSQEEKARLDQMLTDNVCGTGLYKCAENILIFASTSEEAGTDEIINKALNDGKNVFCPKITDTQNKGMDFWQIKSLSDLKEGYRGIREPAGTNVFSREAEGNILVILPGLVFDTEGNRLGYGAGFYDRYIERLCAMYEDDRITLAGIGYSFQVSQNPISAIMDTTDKKVGYVVTDKECISCGK
ncbi:5-formyltetrahydrofolate cyclo-ligase [Butyrivibrio sp. NC2002]|uniref:5-formyltetrahydrofolate cyclo-ligase n=1 Tax=Butyrivibrio sp. NC2002 TaxID=1410610 RepID=UPI0009E062B4|nr:5-formyltetrahydrofolate cyclo-ligase [Butyrivibrio sp. NC2002]